MTYPNDPNQGGWNPGSQGQGGESAWNEFGRQDSPPTQSYGQQPPPTQAFGWQPQPPPAQPGQQPPGGMPPGPPYGPPPQGWGPSGPGGEPPRSRAGLWIALAVAVLLIAGGLTTWLVLRNNDTTADPGPSTPGTSQQTSQSAPINPTGDPGTTDQQTTDEQTTEESTTEEPTTDEPTTDEQTTEEPTTEESTTDEQTTEESTTEESTTEESTTEEPTTEEKTTAAVPPAAPSVAVGDCIRIQNADNVVISRSVVDCGADNAVYEVTEIVDTKSECDPTEATLPGTSGGLPDQVLCLLANLSKGDCWRTEDAANGDYERIDCKDAKSTDNEVVFESRTDADPAQCPKGSTDLSYEKRKVLLCYTKVS